MSLAGIQLRPLQAYLVPALNRPSLKIMTDSYVHKILTGRAGDEVVATGVQFEHGGKIPVVAAKEVIVSAGYGMISFV